jgi:hypothetical protein
VRAEHEARVEVEMVGVVEELGCESDRDYECRRVHEGLRKIARGRALLDAAEADLLREAKALKMWRKYGYSTFLEYLEHELGYGPRTAQERLRVADALEDLPVMAECLARQELHQSAVRELTRVATRETEDAWIEAARGKNLREIEELVAGHKYGDLPEDPVDPAVRRRKVTYEILPVTYSALRQARAVLETERGERLDDDDFLQSLCRRALEPTAGGAGKPAYQMAIVTCRHCDQSWDISGGRELEVDSATLARARCDAALVGDLDQAPGRTTSTVTPRLRKHVFLRDGNCCTVPGCRSVRNLDLHHLVHQADGGRHHASNLTVLCSGHHQRHHEGRLAIHGTAPDHLVFERLPDRGAGAPTWARDDAGCARDDGSAGTLARRRPSETGAAASAAGARPADGTGVASCDLDKRSDRATQSAGAR